MKINFMRIKLKHSFFAISICVLAFVQVQNVIAQDVSLKIHLSKVFSSIGCRGIKTIYRKKQY